jgi:membrane-bound lytic murein transglycosylase A
MRPAIKASKRIKYMYVLKSLSQLTQHLQQSKLIGYFAFILTLQFVLSSCGSLQPQTDVNNPLVSGNATTQSSPPTNVLPQIINYDQGPTRRDSSSFDLTRSNAVGLADMKARWSPVSWDDLPGWAEESMPQVWHAFLSSCEQAFADVGNLCSKLKLLNASDELDKRFFLMSHLQPYKITNAGGDVSGLLTGYYEPTFSASRIKKTGFEIPLYAPLDEIMSLRASNSKWYTRQEIDSSPTVQKLLRRREIVWMSDPLDLLILQIQGSGRLNVLEADGTRQWIKVVYAASNEHGYQSVGKYLLDRGEITDASWPGIKSWVNKNPGRLNELIWSNPRYIFFKEEPLKDPNIGPKGAQGVPLTPGRSVAVDPRQIPYGTPLWLFSDGPTLQLKKLVLAQDTGVAIVGPTRADYFVGTGFEAGEIAGRLKQNLNMWALLPR